MKKNVKNGFTLAEVIITLSVVGVVAIVMIGVLGRVKPDEEKMMFRKAFYTVDKIVSELMYDEEIYPDSTDLTDTSEVTYNGVTYSGTGKFCKLFLAKLKVAEVVADCSADASERSWYDKQSFHGGGSYFITTDGMAWSVPKIAYDPPGEDKYYDIWVDINGLENGPNCADVHTTATMPGTLVVSCDEGSTYDRFVIQVFTDGRVSVLDGTKAQEYLSDTSVN